MNGNWTEIAPDNLERMIAHVKSNGYLDRDNTIRVDFDDFCNLLRRLQEQSVKARAAYEAGEIAMKERTARMAECVDPEGMVMTAMLGDPPTNCRVKLADAIRALPLSGAEESKKEKA